MLKIGDNIYIGTISKGGCGKTTTVSSLAFGLAAQGKKVLAVDADPQHSLSIALGMAEPEKVKFTLANALRNIIEDRAFNLTDGIVTHSEGVDFIPANNDLTSMEIALVQVIGRENTLRRYIEPLKDKYDTIIIDTSPSLGLLTINALAAADTVIVPVTPKFLDAKGLELLLQTVALVRRQINPYLNIGGILLTQVDRRTNFTREIISLIEKSYGGDIKIFSANIPRSVRAAETSARGISIFKHDPRGKVALAYRQLTGEVSEIA